VQNHPEEAELLNREINDFGWKRCVMGDFSLHCDAQQKRAVSLKSTKSLHNASSLKGGICVVNRRMMMMTSRLVNECRPNPRVRVGFLKKLDSLYVGTEGLSSKGKIVASSSKSSRKTILLVSILIVEVW
jgi:hypothetical protein